MTSDAPSSLADIPAPYRARLVARSGVILDSYRRLIGRDLIARSGDAGEDAARLCAAPFVVLSHGTQADPLLDYANAAALALWEMPLEQLIGMPSRQTAEPINQEARERFLQQSRQRGFATGYEGVRIAASGRRFRIEDATLWNLADAEGRAAGQAATFARWTHLG